MGRAQKFFIQLTISAGVAIASPAIAAGLVAGTSAAATAGSDGLSNTVYPTDDQSGSAVSSDSATTATHGPAKLSALAGNDDAAWKSAHSVHVDFSKRKPH